MGMGSDEDMIWLGMSGIFSDERMGWAWFGISSGALEKSFPL